MKIQSIYMLLLGCVALIGLSTCRQHKEPQDPSLYIIDGELASTGYDGTWIYLAPLEGATTENIDSVQIQEGRFRFSGCGEEMRVIRMPIRLRPKFEELLVVTEPGLIWVRIDSISESQGTPQNDALQNWKMRKRESDTFVRDLKRQLSIGKAEDSAKIQNSIDFSQSLWKDYHYEFLQKHIHETVGKFLYNTTRGALTNEQLHELACQK